MRFILKHRLEILLLLFITSLFFILRVPNLTLQPIFADEAIYIRWAQVMKSEPTLRFLPLTDGKTPLFMWAMMPLFKIFDSDLIGVDDPLFAGRFLSNLSGFLSLVGVFALGWRVFNLRVALWSALIYAVVPYAVFFDRMALVDSMLAFFSVWSLFLAIVLLKFQRLDLAMVLGYFLGGALLTKTPAMMGLLALPFTIIGFKFSKTSKYQLVKLFGCWIIAAIIALTIYNLLRLGPGFQQLSARNADYIFSPLELLPRPLDPFIPHLRDISDWFPKLLTWPILLLGVFGIGRIIWVRNRLALVVLVWAAIPLLLQMVFLKTFTARYLLFSVVPLLIFAGAGIDILIGKVSKVIKVSILPIYIVSLGVLIFPAVLFDRLLLIDPETAPLPRAERRGYLEDWTAGYGLKEIAGYLIEKKAMGPVVVGTEGSFGTLPDGLMIYLDKENIAVLGGTATISAKLREATKSNQTFFIANKNRMPKGLPGLELIKEYPKANPPSGVRDAILFFRVLSIE